MASRDLSRTPGRRLGTETKHAFKTTEFWTYLAAVIAVLIAADSIGSGAHDVFRADKAWLFVTILTVGYLISRGLAKAGSREPYSESPPTSGSAGITDRLTKAAAVLRDGEVSNGEPTPSTGPGEAVRIREPPDPLAETLHLETELSPMRFAVFGLLIALLVFVISGGHVLFLPLLFLLPLGGLLGHRRRYGRWNRR